MSLCESMCDIARQLVAQFVDLLYSGQSYKGRVIEHLEGQNSGYIYRVEYAGDDAAMGGKPGFERLEGKNHGCPPNLQGSSGMVSWS